jgi:hypothetical protein
VAESDLDLKTSVGEAGGRRPWWQHRNGGPNLRVLTLVAAIAAVASVLVSILYTDHSVSTEIATQNNSIGNTYNFYKSTDGAPGQSEPQASKECGDESSNVGGGWGPDRPTFTVEHPPSYTTLNAIRDNPDYGDERGLMTVKDSNDRKAGGWTYSVDVQPGHTYFVRLYIENSTAGFGDDLDSMNTRVSINLPTCAGNRIASNGFVDSNTAYPMKIWGGVTFKSAKNFAIAYVPGTAELITNALPDGIAVSDESFLTSSGTPIGYEKLDGVLRPGAQYSCFFIFEVRPQFTP